jgi:choline dehydrogenase
MLSGIGPADHLKNLDIPVVLDLPGVGQNLQEHPGVLLSSEVSVRTYNVETDIGSVIKHGLNWIVRGRGPGTTPIGHAVAFAKTRDGLRDADVQLVFTPIGYNTAGDGPLLHPRPAIVIAVNVCRPQSRGALTLRSSDPFALPVIRHNMFSDPDDLTTLRAGAKLGRAMMRSRAFASVIGTELKPALDTDTDGEWDNFLRRETGRFSHPVGTCRMGTDPASVVDPQLRVHGLEGLSVADASIMPRLPSANTNAAAIMIGEKAADLVKGHDKFKGEARS